MLYNVYTQFTANCFAPVLYRGVVLLSSTSTFAGSVIIYNCSEGFQPGTINMSVCADNGQWILTQHYTLVQVI